MRKAALAFGLLTLLGGPAPAAVGPEGVWVQQTVPADPPYGMDGWSGMMDSRRARVIAFGGGFITFWHGPIAAYDPATYAYDALSGAWSEAAQPNDLAPTRVQYGAVAYDSLADVAWAYGGARWNPFAATWEGFDPRVFRLDFSQPSPAWYPTSLAGTAPAARRGAMLAFDSIDRAVVMFGGRDANGVAQSDLWSLPIPAVTPTQWSQVAATGTTPSPREGAGFLFDPRRRRMILVGGLDQGGNPLRDVHSLDLSSNSWSVLPMGPSGTVAVALDFPRDRLVALTASAGSVETWELDLATDTWRQMAPAGVPPAARRSRFVAVMDPVRDQLVDIGSDFIDVYEQFVPIGYVRPHVLHFSDLPLVQLNATLSATYQYGFTHLRFDVHTQGALYGAVTIERIDPSGPVRLLAASPDPDGILQVDDTIPVAGRHYEYQLRWYDGTRFATTPPLSIDTPPAPIDLPVSLATLALRGDQIVVGWSVPEDSASWLAPLAVEERIGQGPWNVISLTYSLDGSIELLRPAEPVPTQHAFRLAWGPTHDEYRSAADSITTLPLPISLGAAANAAGGVAEWRWVGTLPFQGQVYRTDIDPLVAQAVVNADANGLLHYDDPYTGSGLLAYQLGWDVGGVERRTEEIQTVVDSGENVDLLSVVAADTASVTLTWGDPSPIPNIALVLERLEGTTWTKLADLSTSTPPAQRSYRDMGVTRGAHEQYRMLWPRGGVYVHSHVLAVDVPDSNGVGPPPPIGEIVLGPPSPNPARGSIRMSVSIPTGTTSILSVFDAAGRLVQSKTMAAAAAWTATVVIEDLRPGMYFVRLTSAMGTRSQKAVLVP